MNLRSLPYERGSLPEQVLEILGLLGADSTQTDVDGLVEDRSRPDFSKLTTCRQLAERKEPVKLTQKQWKMVEAAEAVSIYNCLKCI